MKIRGSDIPARMLNAFTRFLSRIGPYTDVVVISTMVTLFLIGLYTGQIPVTTLPPREQPHLAPPSVERIVTFVMVLAGLTMTFTMLKIPWDYQVRPIGQRIRTNMRLAIVKGLAIFTVAMSMSSGLDLLIESTQLNSTASTLDLGIVAAALLALYGPTKMLSDRTPSLEDVHDIVKDFILGLLLLDVMVNLLVTIPAAFPPFAPMITVAIVATIADGLLSLITANWDRIVPVITRHLET